MNKSKFNINDKVTVCTEGFEIPAVVSDVFELPNNEFGYEIEYFDHKKDVFPESQLKMKAK